MNAALFGSLSRFPPVYILRLLQLSHASGRLELVRGDEQADIWISNGVCQYTRTGGRRLRVGDLLVHHGHILPPVMELALAIQADLPGQRIGAMLIEGGAISETQLIEALLAVQRHLLAGVMLWRAGKFRFMADETLPQGAEEITLASDGQIEDMLQSILALAEHERQLHGPAAPEREPGEQAA